MVAVASVDIIVAEGAGAAAIGWMDDAGSGGGTGGGTTSTLAWRGAAYDAGTDEGTVGNADGTFPCGGACRYIYIYLYRNTSSNPAWIISSKGYDHDDNLATLLISI